jgi:hypothetical protein
MKRLFAAVAVVAAMVGSSASAFDPADLKKLKETNECAAEFEIWFNAIATVEKLTLDDWITSKIAAKINNE